jgi:hypothetical protein
MENEIRKQEQEKEKEKEKEREQLIIMHRILEERQRV